ncbi:DUF1127 domain-containing protein [Histidinibacterium aquaticum]|uniref:DUF1127 domain-containing protein n=1 Tax=Histidinibacterium aquaticum TaxID=2613962 RepID=A0A5J5GC60_9RHOB|nr:DUF1127 domain-containing protein [Histidinibacterium aquaticum]KAA9005611.1 DUF1127 domain-containing protein [Histidinibacterium aquaticum]
MTATTNTTLANAPAGTGLWARVRAAYTDWSARRAIYAQTYRELSQCSDRDLADLGFSRYDIPYIAERAARGI